MLTPTDSDRLVWLSLANDARAMGIDDDAAVLYAAADADLLSVNDYAVVLELESSYAAAGCPRARVFRQPAGWAVKRSSGRAD